MADVAITQPIVAQLRAQLTESRQQEERLKHALTRVLKLLDEANSPG